MSLTAVVSPRSERRTRHAGASTPRPRAGRRPGALPGAPHRPRPRPRRDRGCAESSSGAEEPEVPGLCKPTTRERAPREARPRARSTPAWHLLLGGDRRRESAPSYRRARRGPRARAGRARSARSGSNARSDQAGESAFQQVRRLVELADQLVEPRTASAGPEVSQSDSEYFNTIGARPPGRRPSARSPPQRRCRPAARLSARGSRTDRVEVLRVRSG